MKSEPTRTDYLTVTAFCQIDTWFAVVEGVVKGWNVHFQAPYMRNEQEFTESLWRWAEYEVERLETAAAREKWLNKRIERNFYPLKPSNG